MNELNILPYADLSDDALMGAALCQDVMTDLERELVERLERANMRIGELMA